MQYLNPYLIFIMNCLKQIKNNTYIQITSLIGIFIGIIIGLHNCNFEINNLNVIVQTAKFVIYGFYGAVLGAIIAPFMPLVLIVFLLKKLINQLIDQ